MEKCDAVIEEYGGFPLIETLLGDDTSWMERTARIQPVLWAMSVSLAALWRSWGVAPDAVIGHSQGEIPAAYCAGALTLEESGRASCVRAALIDDLAEGGALCWVEVASAEVPDLLRAFGATAEVAVEESPGSSVLAGTPEQIDRIVAGCEESAVSCVRVKAGYAAHTSCVDPVRAPLLESLADLMPRETSVPFLSTVTAGPSTARCSTATTGGATCANRSA